VDLDFLFEPWWASWRDAGHYPGSRLRQPPVQPSLSHVLFRGARGVRGAEVALGGIWTVRDSGSLSISREPIPQFPGFDGHEYGYFLRYLLTMSRFWDTSYITSFCDHLRVRFHGVNPRALLSACECVVMCLSLIDHCLYPPQPVHI
jgi:hypothetical protein